jgi:hypothetical protein
MPADNCVNGAYLWLCILCLLLAWLTVPADDCTIIVTFISVLKCLVLTVITVPAADCASQCLLPTVFTSVCCGDCVYKCLQLKCVHWLAADCACKCLLLILCTSACFREFLPVPSSDFVYKYVLPRICLQVSAAFCVLYKFLMLIMFSSACPRLC